MLEAVEINSCLIFTFLFFRGGIRVSKSGGGGERANENSIQYMKEWEMNKRRKGRLLR
jgi:hypothetical protein